MTNKHPTGYFDSLIDSDYVPTSSDEARTLINILTALPSKNEFVDVEGDVIENEPLEAAIREVTFISIFKKYRDGMGNHEEYDEGDLFWNFVTNRASAIKFLVQYLED